MQNKWFQSRRSQDTAAGQANGAPAHFIVPSAENGASPSDAHGSNNPVALNTELMVFDEIYKSAGIKTPKQGYSIAKVIEMLHSEHICNLPNETRRASLLMALEAAGVQVDEVLQDATLRQRAINSYEAIHRKHLEEFEARKAQENCAIQAEMERVAAEYAARISNNLDEVAREKDSFRKWQTRKQQEAQSITEAVALCVTQSGAKPEADPLAPLRELAARNDAVYRRG